jgi:hypothetical protein
MFGATLVRNRFSHGGRSGKLNDVLLLQGPDVLAQKK